MRNIFRYILKLLKFEDMFNKVKVTCVDNEDLHDWQKKIIFATITMVVNPVENVRSLEDLNGKEFEIKPISREKISKILDDKFYQSDEMWDDIDAVVQLDFDDNNKLRITPVEDEEQYAWSDNKHGEFDV